MSARPPFSSSASWSAERHRFIEAGGNTSHAFGLGRMIGRAYAMLYLMPNPMPLEEIADNLGVSKASASTVLRQLASWQAVRQIWVSGDRRDFYEAEIDFSVILREGLMPGIRKKLLTAGTQIERTINATTTTTTATGAGASISSGEDGPTQEEASPLPKEVLVELRRRLRAAQVLHQRLDKILGSKLLARFL